MESKFVCDPAFNDIATKKGITIWRVEKMKLVPISSEDYGYFFTGDSYVCLMATNAGCYDIHFWLGEESTRDETGVAAVKTVELDDVLDGKAIQHREVQEHESQKFLSYFKDGLKYLQGGIESGFKHVERNQAVKKLYKIKGKRNVRVQQVEFSWDSFNQGDVFIIDLGSKIYIWNGTESNGKERIKGMQIARNIRDSEYGGRAHLTTLTGDTCVYSKEITDVLGPCEGFKGAEEEEPDEVFSRDNIKNTKLFKVSDAEGSLQLTEIEVTPLTQDLLDTNDCYIVDQGASGIYVWKGKHATRQERSGSMKYAQEFISQRNLPEHTNITTVPESAETAQFKAIFKNWEDLNETKDLPETFKNLSRIAKVEKKTFDASLLHSKRKELDQNGNFTAEEKIIEEGSYNIQVWRTEQSNLVPVSEEQYGQFFSGDSYLVFYTQIGKSRKKSIIYFWLGRSSTTDERASVAFHAVQLDNKYGGSPVQVRVTQGKEPNHFLQIFRGKFIIYSGGKASSFRGTKKEDEYYTGGVRLFHIRGTNKLNTKAVQVKHRASSLNSNDVFILQTDTDVYVWCGKGSSTDEVALAENVVNTIALGRSLKRTLVNEEEEPEEFWTALGGREAYASDKSLQEEVPTHPPRLFHCSNAKGYFHVEEIFDYTQDDLIADDVMLLDTYAEIFIWIGKDSNKEEKEGALSTAEEYVKSDPSGRDEDATSLIIIKQGFEPVSFTGYFHAWDPERYEKNMSEERMQEELRKENAALALTMTELSNMIQSTKKEYHPKYYPKYPYKHLVSTVVPADVDKEKKELYLSPEEFLTAFSISFDEFRKLPQWKKNFLKKKCGLF